MYSLLSGLYKWMKEKEEKRMVFLGLDYAGKTTSLEQLKGTFSGRQMDVTKIPPTIGFNTARLNIGDTVAVFWDLGGQANFRVVWQNYFEEVQGIVWVVDSNDPKRLQEAKDVLKDTLAKIRVDVPVLVLANKQDIDSALTCEQVHKLMEIEVRKIKVLLCSILRI